MLCSDNVWSLKFPADKENTRWVLCNHFSHAHAGLLIYLCITQEGAAGFTKLQLFGFCVSVLPRRQRSLSALRRCLIVPFSVSMQTPRLFSDPANIGAANSRR